MSDETFPRVQTLIARYMEIDAGTIRPETSLEELGMDSFDGLEVAFRLEEEFDVEIPNERVTEFSTVGAICAGLEALRSAPQAS